MGLAALLLWGCQEARHRATEAEDADRGGDAAALDAGPPDAQPVDVDTWEDAAPDVDAEDAAEDAAEVDAGAADAGPAQLITLAGHVTAIDRPFTSAGFTGEEVVRPAPDVTVEVVAAAGGRALATVQANADGAFELTVVAPPGPLRLRARAEVHVAGLSAAVRDAGGALYVVEGPEIPGESGEGFALHAAGPSAGAAFHILEEARHALVVIADEVEGARATLTYRWQAGVPWPCGSCYSRDAILLGGGLADPDEFDDVIILHELGHWFVAHFSADDSPGGTHRDLLVSPQLAYGEGVAYFFAALVRDVPEVVDTFIDSLRFIDLEAVTLNGETDDAFYGTANGRPSGAQREELTAALLWDFYDETTDAEPFDAVALGRAGMFGVLVDIIGGGALVDVGARGVDITDWLNLLSCTASPVAVQALAAERAFPWSVANDARCGKGLELPPFTLVEHDGGVWIDAAVSLPPLRLHQASKASKASKARALTCDAPCRVGDADPWGAVVVTTPGQPWAGLAWLGARKQAALAGGRVTHGLRILPSIPAPAAAR